MDANCSFPARHLEDDDLLAATSPIGPLSFGKSSWQTSRVHSFLQHLDLVAVNTYRGTAGPTWFGPRSKTQIDFVALPRAKLADVFDCSVWVDAARELQLSGTFRLNDHAPVVASFWNWDWFGAPGEGSADAWNKETIARATASGDMRDAFRARLETLAAETDFQTNFESALSHGDLECTFGTVQQVLYDSADMFRGRATSIYEKPLDASEIEVANARARLWEAKSENIDDTSGLSAAQKTLMERRRRARVEHCARKLKGSKRRNFQVKLEGACVKIAEAAEEGRSKDMWAGIRRWFGAKVGARGRRFGSAPKALPTASEWHARLQRPAPQGGMGGSCLGTLESLPDGAASTRLAQGLALQRGEARVDHLADGTYSEEALQEMSTRDYEDYVRVLGKSASGKAVPPWSIPADVET
jgi:hypothetical protein